MRGRSVFGLADFGDGGGRKERGADQNEGGDAEIGGGAGPGGAGAAY